MSDSLLMADLLEEICQRLEAGQPVDISQYAELYPHLESQLRQLVPAMAVLGELSEITSDLPSTQGQHRFVTPTSLGDFQIVREIGRGGMGVVYEAQQLSLSRRVAVKILPFAALWPATALQRFHHEVRVAALLEHPHIVPVYSVGCERGVHFYVMKLINGCSLADVIRIRQTAATTPSHPGPINPILPIIPIASSPGWYLTAARLAHEAAQGLAFAHHQGVIHRDIKPSNLLLDREGHLFVTDFGLARFESDVNLTRTGDLLGTPRYMSPEQAAGDSKQLDARTDIFSLGATLYELLTLHPVVNVRGRAAAIRALKELKVIPLRTYDRDIPRPLEQIVLKCLHPNPRNRYASAAELADDLQRFLEGRPVTARLPGFFFLHRASRWLRRHPRVTLRVVASMIISLLMVAIGAWSAQHRRFASSAPRGPPPGNVVADSSDVSSLIDLSPDLESPDMLRTSPAKSVDQTRRNRRPNHRQPIFEQLEDRSLLAVTTSISDASAMEGNNTIGFVDDFVTANSGGLSRARNVIFGPDGNLYVASRDNDAVLRYNGANGAFMDTFVASGSGGLVSPWAITFGPDGNLYVTGALSDNVLRFNGATGTFIDEYIPSGSFGLNEPKGIVFGPDGNLYVSNSAGPSGAIGLHEVLRVEGPFGTSPGAALPAPGQSGAVFVSDGSGGLSNPNGLSFGPDGSFYVASTFQDSVNRYDGTTGAFLDLFVPPNSGGLDTPNYLSFRPDGLYVVSQSTHEVLRYNAITGAFLDAAVPAQSGGLWGPGGLAFDSTGNLYISSNDFVSTMTSQVLRYGPESQVAFTVSLSEPSGTSVSVSFDTANGSAVANSDYVAVSGTVIFAPGITTRTILVSTLDNAAYEPTETFTVNLSNPVGVTIADGVGVGTILDNDPFTKFYVVNDSTTNRTYEYDATGAAVENYPLNSGNAAPRGAASTESGTTVWVVDANKKVYSYDTNGALLGSWTAGSLASNAQPAGIATDGTDVWIVDRKSDKVFTYTGAASRVSGSQNADGSFALASGNNSPTDIVTDGVHLWVVNDGSSTDKVFKYTVAGALVGSWTITTSGAGSPTGITIDPSNLSDIWIVDSSADKVFQYTGAASLISGSQSAAASFALAPGNTNPQGIADPPPPVGEENENVNVPSGGSAEATDRAFDQLLNESGFQRSGNSREVDQSNRRVDRTTSAPARIPRESIPQPSQRPRSSDILNSSPPKRQIDSLDQLFFDFERHFRVP